ncbi:hypothetical protein [Methanogenium cariaci]|uniref:hypothetical protein n=1 Tax=Methanogenium cariaci TaxID=2197 RepID=UPI0012F6671B|nr:hypothetical protein [Methanogenium cariaci]
MESSFPNGVPPLCSDEIYLSFRSADRCMWTGGNGLGLVMGKEVFMCAPPPTAGRGGPSVWLTGPMGFLLIDIPSCGIQFPSLRGPGQI